MCLGLLLLVSDGAGENHHHERGGDNDEGHEGQAQQRQFPAVVEGDNKTAHKRPDVLHHHVDPHIGFDFSKNILFL